MNALAGDLAPVFGLFSLVVALAIWALSIAARLAPWFLKETVRPPTVRSFFLDPAAEGGVTERRLVVAGIAAAIVLAIVLSFVVAAKAQGWSPTL